MAWREATVSRSHSLRSSTAAACGSCFAASPRPTLLKFLTFITFSHSLNRSMRRSIVPRASVNAFLSRTSLSLSLRGGVMCWGAVPQARKCVHTMCFEQKMVA